MIRTTISPTASAITNQSHFERSNRFMPHGNFESSPRFGRRAVST
jgi:hypothetical protein